MPQIKKIFLAIFLLPGDLQQKKKGYFSQKMTTVII